MALIDPNPMEGIQDRGVTVEEGNLQPIAISVKNLSFSYKLDVDSIKNQFTSKPALNNINMEIPHGSRVLVVGMNGSGKSTLLKCLAGKFLVEKGTVKIFDRDVFYDTTLNNVISYVKPDEWAMSAFSEPPFSSVSGSMSVDLSVGEMMNTLQDKFKSRRDELVDILQIDLNWRMTHVLNNEHSYRSLRAKVALFLNLIKPYKVLLLDESLSVLDVMVRKRLLAWLREESNVKGCTIIYATQVISDLGNWPTHVVYLQLDGELGCIETLKTLYENETHPKQTPDLQGICEQWFKDELGAIRVKIFSRTSSLNSDDGSKRGADTDRAIAEAMTESMKATRKTALPIDAEYRTSINPSMH